MRVAWLLPLSHDALKAIELALSVVHSVVANAEKKPALPEGTASQKGSEEDENVRGTFSALSFSLSLDSLLYH
jgi:hypothetical protein